MDYIYKMRVQGGYPIAALNMSLGSGRYSYYCDDLDGEAFLYSYAAFWLRSVDVAPIAASGNEGYRDSMAIPGCVYSVVGVGAVCDTTEPN